MTEEKYLWISLRDSDFIYDLQMVGQCLMDVGYFELCEIKEEDLSELSKYIKHMLYGFHNAVYIMEHYPYMDDIKIFDDLKLKIVNYSDIPYEDNGESVYIPLFEDKFNDKIITR